MCESDYSRLTRKSRRTRTPGPFNFLRDQIRVIGFHAGQCDRKGPRFSKASIIGAFRKRELAMRVFRRLAGAVRPSLESLDDRTLLSTVVPSGPSGIATGVIAGQGSTIAPTNGTVTGVRSFGTITYE